MLNSRTEVPPLKTIYMYISGECNLKCRHCWIDPAFAKKAQKYLSWGVLKKIFEEAKEIGLASVKLTGGEPFLHPEILDVIKGIKEMNLGVTVETNGTMIDERAAKTMKENARFVAISLDGAEAHCHEDLRAVRGCFEETLKGAENLKKEGMPFQVIFSLYRKNADDLYKMPEFVKKIGGTSLKVNPVTLISRSEKMRDSGELFGVGEILEIKKDFLEASENSGLDIIFDVPAAFQSLQHLASRGFGTCGILGILGILCDGKASVCGIGSVRRELDFGNCADVSIKKIWFENRTLEEIRKNIPEKLRGICGDCVHKKYCLGKCVAETYNRTGGFLEGFSFCSEAFAKGFFPQTRLVK